MPSRDRLVIERLLKFRWIAAVVGIVVFGCALPIANRLEMDRDISAMFDRNDPSLLAYQDLQATFGGNAVAMIVYRDANLMSPAGIDRSAELTASSINVPGVRDVLSPSRISDLVGKLNPVGLLSGSDGPPLLDPNDPVAQGMDEIFAGYTHSSDDRFAAVVSVLDQDHSPQTIEQLRTIAGEFGEQHDEVSEISLVGEPVLIHDGFALIQRDGDTLATWTIVLLSIVVLVSMFDLRFVLLMAFAVTWSVTLTRALLVLASIELSLVSTILTAIVTVITVASVLHLGVKFRTARGRGKSRRESTQLALSRLIVPIFWTCATDAAGFAALTWSRILPVQQFGQMIAIAAVTVFGAMILFAPATMMLPSLSIGNGIAKTQRTTARRLNRVCRSIARRFVRSPGRSLVAALLVTAFAIVGLVNNETETSFLKNFRDHSPVVSAYQNVEQNFGGAGVWDIVVDAPAELSEAFMSSVRDLQHDLRSIDVDGQRLTKVLSIVDIDGVASQSMILKLAPVSVRLAGMRVALPVFSDALLSPVNATESHRKRRLRIMLRSREHLGAEQKHRLIKEVQTLVRRHTSDESWTALINDSSGSDPSPGITTGYYVMMADLVGQLVHDQWRCFTASGLIVLLLLVIATGSLRLAMAALVPNLLPVLMVLAIVGLAGGKINMGAAMIAAVSIGLSIDGSVHFLASYQSLRRRGHGAATAAVHAAGNIGVPVFLATVALVIGFSVLATSEFVPTATFGVLVAATMAAGTVVNLTLLPAIVSWVDN